MKPCHDGSTNRDFKNAIVTKTTRQTGKDITSTLAR